MKLELENLDQTKRNPTHVSELAERFSSLERGNLDRGTFTELETILEQVGFDIAAAPEAIAVLNRSDLLCRNESFSTLLNLIVNDENINLDNPHEDANVCSMSGGAGFRTAMLEGFAGKDVGHHIKTVISFLGKNLEHAQSIPRDHSLWQLKPDTARVSKAARGQITQDDVEMISCRYPVDFYPEELLTEEELEKLDADDLRFIVRHYIKNRPLHNEGRLPDHSGD